MKDKFREAIERMVDFSPVRRERPTNQRPGVGVTRRAAFVPLVRGVNDAKRKITFVASDETPDRYGDVIRASGWKTKNYMKNPVFLWAHRSSEPPIGKTTKLVVENEPPALVQTVEFADDPVADRVFRLYKGGFLKAVSVGFKPLEWQPIEDDEGRITGHEFTKQELLELSAVPIPANPNALARAVDEGILTAADAEKLFPDSADDVAAARALLARAAAPNAPVACSDDEALLRAAIVRFCDEISPALKTMTCLVEQLARVKKLEETLRGLELEPATDLDRFLGALAEKSFGSMEDLERALRGEP
jgi:HK97 family phage prohead protease